MQTMIFHAVTGEGGQVTKLLRAYVQKVGAISEWTGKTVCFIGLALVFTITIDVFLRYVFNAPTKWSYDITYMLGGTLLIVPAGYVLYHKGHVAIDIVRRAMPRKVGLTLDLILDLVFFFPLVIVLLYMGTDHAITSIAQRELSNVGFWRPPLYPFRTMIPVAYFLLLIQGIATFIQNAYELLDRGGEL